MDSEKLDCKKSKVQKLIIEGPNCRQ
uniref:Uncharacterized protein n=1 Tax=Arundo donax TaxID=35708 RepID=A0A0A9A592_ARUDO